MPSNPDVAARPPLSFAQARMWLLNQLSGPDSQYNVPLVIRSRHELEVQALRDALHDVLMRHEILRARYEVMNGVPVQSVQSAAAVRDVLSVERCPQPSLEARIAAISAYGFDLGAEIPLRAWLLAPGPAAGDVLVLLVHHIAVDGSSLWPLLRDLGTAYAARRAGARPDWDSLRIQYSDYASWQRDLLGDPDAPGSLAAQQLEYWRGKLAQLPAEIALPTDRPRPVTADACADADTVFAPVPAELRRRVFDAAQAEGVTPLTLFRAALAAFLTRSGAGVDIALGGFVTGRVDAGLDDLIGFFVNTLVIRVDADGGLTFRELLHRVKIVEREAYAHQDVPFDLIVRILNPARSSRRHPLVQTALSFEDRVTCQVPGLDAEMQISQLRRAKFDLYLCVVVDRDPAGTPSKLSVDWNYATALFDRRTVESMAENFTTLLHSAVTDPDRSLDELRLVTPS